MKKLVGILMMVVLMVMAVNAIADIEIYPTCDEAITLLNEWALTWGYNDCYEENIVDGCAYYVGVLDKSEFECRYELEASNENFMDISLADEDFDIYWIASKQVGEIEGHAVYYCYAMGHGDLANGCKKAGVLWMICD